MERFQGWGEKIAGFKQTEDREKRQGKKNIGEKKTRNEELKLA